MAKSKLAASRKRAISKVVVQAVVELTERKLVAWQFDRECQIYHLDLEIDAFPASQRQQGGRASAPAIQLRCKGDWPRLTGKEIRRLVANLEKDQWDLDPVMH